MNTSRYQLAIDRIDEENSRDPHTEISNGKKFPREFLYSLRMSEKLIEYKPQASEILRVAARAQHICRWKIARENYPMDRTGYLRWRTELKEFHANLTSEILKEAGYDDGFIQAVKVLLKKEGLKTNPETQILEDVICFVFLEFYFEDFQKQHSEEKLINILQKTWKKMSLQGQSFALTCSLSSSCRALIQKALAG